MEGGHIVAFQAIARDVTVRKAMEAERQRLGSWNQLESHLTKKKSGTQVSHGICPECMRS
jgi:hypothetical protein